MIGLFVNAWIGVPSIMLLATGMLSNRDESLYEAARIDGASNWVQFKKITMPYILTATTPVLIVNLLVTLTILVFSSSYGVDYI